MINSIYQTIYNFSLLNPYSPALIYNDTTITYSSLIETVERVAINMDKKGVVPNNRVAIHIANGTVSIVCILALLKLGVTYLPLENQWPSNRIEYILADSEADFIITDNNNCDNLNLKRTKPLYYEQLNLATYSNNSITHSASATDIAYIIYTSGSTGQPKGVQISHANLLNLFNKSQPIFNFSWQDTWLLFHSIAFDFSVWEIFGALLYGSQLIIPTLKQKNNLKELYKLIVGKNISIVNFTPSALFNFLSINCMDTLSTSNIRLIILGGEKFNPYYFKAWQDYLFKTNLKLVNMYGITEGTVHVTCHFVAEDEFENNISLIGRPYTTKDYCVINETGRLVVSNEIGELCIAGQTLFSGYLNKPQLNEEKFITLANTSLKFFRTGDRVRVLKDGKLEYIGRQDDQVKLNGYRIELQEIEYHLCNNSVIQSAAVVLQIDEFGNKWLTAYYIANKLIDETSIRYALSKVLPEYMIPLTFNKISHIPLTSNGKVNRYALTNIIKFQ